MACKHWTDDDSGYEQWLASHPDGFMANLNREPHERYCCIHRASHKLPDRSNSGSINPRTGNNYSKVTADELSELLAWVNANIPSLDLTEDNFCKICNPESDLHVNSSPTTNIEEYFRRANQLLASGHVSRPTGVSVPKVQHSSIAQYFRDPKVRAWVLQRANGCCELCDAPAPFVTSADEFYLESHHLTYLAEGGADTPENTAALCPNCHRKVHYSKDRADLRKTLAQIVDSKEGRESKCIDAI